MALDPETFTEVVRQRVEALGAKVFAVETAHGLAPDTIRNVLRGGAGKSGPTLKKVQQICDALGLELYIGAPRDSGPVEQFCVDGADYAHIPLHDALLAAGPGHSNGPDDIIDHLAFRRDWLRRLGIPASKARLARAHGDSMQPAIWPGDMVLIDTTRFVPPVRDAAASDHRRPPVYALIDDGEARIKRLQRPADDILILVSDNPDYAPEIRRGADLARIRIVGKVVWWGHTAKE